RVKCRFRTALSSVQSLRLSSTSRMWSRRRTDRSRLTHRSSGRAEAAGARTGCACRGGKNLWRLCTTYGRCEPPSTRPWWSLPPLGGGNREQEDAASRGSRLSHASVLGVRPFHLDIVSGHLFEVPRADVADLTIHNVVPSLPRYRIGNRLAKFVGAGARKRVERGHPA